MVDEPLTLDGVAATVATVKRRQGRLRIAGAVLSLFFIASLGVFGGVQQYQNCSKGNEFRKLDKARWDYIISLSPPPAPGSDNAARVARFEAYIRAADHQRDCNPLSSL